MASARRALAWSVLERYLLIAFSLSSNILLARLLSPEEIGVYSVSAAIIGIGHVVRDFGIGYFLIQEKNLTGAHIRTALGMALIIGGTLFSLFWIAAPFVAHYYADPRLLSTVHVSALSFLIIPFGAISQSLLRRDMHFGAILTANLSSATVGFVVTIGLAFAGHGPISMAFGAVASNLTMGLVAWLARKDRKLLRPGLSEWRAVFKFGGQNTLTGVVTTVSTDINDLVLGKVMGFAPVALISRAQGIMNLFHRDLMSAFKSAALPIFAKARREGEDLEAQFHHGTACITVLAWPFYGFASLYALELLRLLFGPQWDSASALVPWFCLGGALLSASSLIPTLLVAAGGITIHTRFETVIQILRAVVLVSSVVLFESLQAFALSFALVSGLSSVGYFVAKQRLVPTAPTEFVRALLQSLIVTGACLLGPLIFTLAYASPATPRALSELLAAAASCALVWLVALILVRHPMSRDPLFQRFFCWLPIKAG